MSALKQTNGKQTTTALVLNASHVREDSEPRAIEPESESRQCAAKVNDANWVMIVIWGFVVFSLAELFCCGLLLWAKCHGH